MCVCVVSGIVSASPENAAITYTLSTQAKMTNAILSVISFNRRKFKLGRLIIFLEKYCFSFKMFEIAVTLK